jgi:hypothetical protein
VGDGFLQSFLNGDTLFQLPVDEIYH